MGPVSDRSASDTRPFPAPSRRFAACRLQCAALPTMIRGEMHTAKTGSQPLRWQWIAAFWIGVGLFDATQTVFVMRAEGMHHAWLALFATQILAWLPWAAATTFVLRLGRRWPPVRLRPYATWLVHLAACAGICLVSGAWQALLDVLLNPLAASPAPGPFLSVWTGESGNGMLSSVFLYAFILAVGYLLDSRERLARQQLETARLNEEFSRAQLEALRRQIEPHFLFNSLNAIAGLIREERNASAVNMVVELSDFLRKVLELSDRQEVPLAEEVQFVQHYLAIQKLRLADRLRVSFDIPAELSSVPVPSLILQPIVENAINHGIARWARGGRIRITAARRDGQLTLHVHNDGPGLPVDWERTQTGIGISNVRTRLQRLYGDGAEFSLRNDGPDGVEASVSIPFMQTAS